MSEERITQVWKLTSSYVRAFINGGGTYDKLCQQCGNCSDEELDRQLEKLFESRRDRQRVIHNLHANAKRKGNKPKGRKTAQRKLKEVPPAQPPARSTQEAPPTDATAPETVAIDTTHDVEEVKTTPDTMKELEAEIEALIRLINNIEAEIHRWNERLQAYSHAFDVIGGRLGRVRSRRKIKEYSQRLWEIRLKKDRIKSILEVEFRPLLKQKEAELEVVYQKIRDKRKLSLYVFDDGIIIDDAGNDNIVPKYTSLYKLQKWLRSRLECGEVRNCDFYTLARLLVFFGGDYGNVELAFDNVALEEAFNGIKGHYDPSRYEHLKK